MRKAPKRPCDIAFSPVNTQRARQQRRATFQGWQDAGNHRLKHRRDPGHDVHVSDRETGGNADRVVDQGGTVGDAGHAQAGGVQLHPIAVVVGRQQGARIVANVDGIIKSGGDAICSDVVMGGANATAGKNSAVGGGQGFDGGNDRGGIIADHADLFEVDTRFCQLPGQMMHIGVSGPAREDFVADHEHGGIRVRTRIFCRDWHLCLLWFVHVIGGPMQFATPLIPARLIRRYKRFLADCSLEDGTEVVAHCANPGSMMGLAEPGTKIWLEPNDDPKKKLKYGWRLVDHENGHFTGVDTSVPNRALKAALQAHEVPGLAYDLVRSEVKYGENSRIDFLLSGQGPDTYVEVKSVTLSRQPGLAEFPDSVTARGTKHLVELAEMVRQGHRAVMLYLVQRTDCADLTLAGDIDGTYVAAFHAARAVGVEVMAFDCAISPAGVDVRRPVRFVDPV